MNSKRRRKRKQKRQQAVIDAARDMLRLWPDERGSVISVEVNEDEYVAFLLAFSKLEEEA